MLDDGRGSQLSTGLWSLVFGALAMVVAGAGLMLATLPFEVGLPDLGIDGVITDEPTSVRCQTPLVSIFRDRPAEIEEGWFVYAPNTDVSMGTPRYCIRKGQDRAIVGGAALVLGLASAVVVRRRSDRLLGST